jgi:hypothetical protein
MTTPDLDQGPDAERRRIIRGRNLVLALVLAGFVVLVFAISLAKMS